MNENSSSGCMIYFEAVDFIFEGSSTINGNNNSSCNALNVRHSKGSIENINISSPKDAMYAISSDIYIKGGSFSSTGGDTISAREGSRFEIESSK